MFCTLGSIGAMQANYWPVSSFRGIRYVAEGDDAAKLELQALRAQADNRTTTAAGL